MIVIETYRLIIAILVILCSDLAAVRLNEVALLGLGEDPSDAVRPSFFLDDLLLPFLVADVLQDVVDVRVCGVQGACGALD